MAEEDATFPPGRPLKRGWTVLLALWIFGLSFFFFVRFSFLVYADQQAPIDRLLEWLRQ